jgi:hypothetical protein
VEEVAKKYKHKRLYKEEVLDPNWEDDGTMVDNRKALEEAVVGHRIVSVDERWMKRGWGREKVTVLTLDSGVQVQLVGSADCCAYTELRAFLLHPEMVDHVITGVGTTDGYTTWHVYADMGDVLELSVDWSCGNPFYYGYGFDIRVVDAA